jgi:DNA-binding IclR family transcriptional regulator
VTVVVPANSRFAAPDHPPSAEGPGDLTSSLGAVGKAMLVLQCFNRSRVPVRLAEITRRTGLAKSTVHRLLAILEEHNAVRRVNSGYVVGEAIRQLSDDNRGAHWPELRRVLMPYLTDLYEATHLVTTLVVPHEFAALALATLYPRSLAGPVLRISDRMPLHCTAVGKLLLAYAPPSAALPHGDRWLVRFASNTITRRAQLDAELARIQRDGIAHSREEYVSGIAGMAVPILDRHYGPIALGVAGPPTEIGSADPEALLRRTAHAASLALRRYRAERVGSRPTASSGGAAAAAARREVAVSGPRARSRAGGGRP